MVASAEIWPATGFRRGDRAVADYYTGSAVDVTFPQWNYATQSIDYVTRTFTVVNDVQQDVDSVRTSFNLMNNLLQDLWFQVQTQFKLARPVDPTAHYTSVLVEGSNVVNHVNVIQSQISILSFPGNTNAWWQVNDYRKFGWITWGADPQWETPVRWISLQNSIFTYPVNTYQQRVILAPGVTALMQSFGDWLPPSLTYTSDLGSGTYPPVPGP